MSSLLYMLLRTPTICLAYGNIAKHLLMVITQNKTACLRPYLFWCLGSLGSLQPRVSSSLYIEMGEFADEPSSLPNVQKRMAVQRVSKL